MPATDALAAAVATAHPNSTYLDAMCKAVSVDKVQVSKYFAWSFMDNFEWRQGFTNRFGECGVFCVTLCVRHTMCYCYWHVQL
jgi:hypothetical protein